MTDPSVNDSIGGQPDDNPMPWSHPGSYGKPEVVEPAPESQDNGTRDGR